MAKNLALQPDGDAAKGADRRALRIGLSVRTLCHPKFLGRLDGIGIYTRELWRRFESMSDVEIHPAVGFGRRWRALAAQYENGFYFPAGYGLSSAMALATNRAFPGTGALSAKIDVYHATDYWIPRLRGIGVVATLHDAIPLSHPEWASPGLRSLKNTLLRNASRWADRVITVSKAMVPTIVEHFGIREDRVAVVHNGVDAAWFERILPDARRAALRTHGLPDRFFIAVGTLQPRKNLGRILEAHRNLPSAIRRECPLVMVGRMGWGVDGLLPLIRKGQASGEVHWLDYVSHAELRALFQSAVALVFPSLHEGFGLPIVEAFASSLPVIASNVSALPEVAGDAALLVDPLDTGSITDAMRQVCEDRELQARLIGAGERRVRQFSWEAAAEKLAAVYRGVARA